LEKHTFYANGKLLITGEYLVIHGALALAVPTSMGQKMCVRRTVKDENAPPGNRLSWKSYYGKDCWFEAEFSMSDLDILSTSDEKIAKHLMKILGAAMELNPQFDSKRQHILLENFLDFDPGWGLGSSSSLISNIAAWFDIDPYKLFDRVQQGSAYDIACSRAKGPIWYRKIKGNPVVQPVSLHFSFEDRLAFVYSGRKQDSTKAVNEFMMQDGIPEGARSEISRISRDISTSKDLEEFNTLLDEHEGIMSGVLNKPRISEQYFSDFPGTIKSLGAWGGDFLLVTHEDGMDGIKPYFSNKDLNTCFSWKEMVLDTE
jgi:mevalonate kinase